MKKAFYLLFLVLMVCSCGSKTVSSVKENDEIIMPECNGEAIKESKIWLTGPLGLSTNSIWCYLNNLPDLYIGLNNNNIYFDIESDIERIPSESSVKFSNAFDSDTLVIKLKDHYARNYDGARAILYLLNHYNKVTLTVDSINEEKPFVFYYESLEGIQEAYAYYVKMFHPDLPGTAVKKVE